MLEKKPQFCMKCFSDDQEYYSDFEGKGSYESDLWNAVSICCFGSQRDTMPIVLNNATRATKFCKCFEYCYAIYIVACQAHPALNS